MALPVGVLFGIYLNELAPPGLRRGVSLVLDVLNGLPSFVIGIFVFGLLVIGHGQAAWKASLSVAPHWPSSVPSPPRLMLTTLMLLAAALAATQSRPQITFDSEPAPKDEKTRTA